MKKIQLFYLLLLLGLNSFAQERAVSSGGQASGPGGTMDFSIGLVDYITVNGAGEEITQGLQQPYEIFKLSDGDQVFSEGVRLYPNPTTGMLILEFETPAIQHSHYVVTNMEGKVINAGKLESHQTGIDLSSQANGAYFLSLKDSKADKRVFKIIKTQ